MSNQAPFAGAVQIPVQEYGPRAMAHVKTFSVSFTGRPGTDISNYSQPVRVQALDESEAWAQVVRHYRIEDCSRMTPTVIRID